MLVARSLWVALLGAALLCHPVGASTLARAQDAPMQAAPDPGESVAESLPDAPTAEQPAPEEQTAEPDDLESGTRMAAAPQPAPGVESQDSVEDESPPEPEEPENVDYFAYIERIDDFVRLSDRDQMSFGNVSEPTKLEGDYNLLTPRTGGAVIRLPGGAHVKMDPDAQASWLDEELILRKGFFEIEAPTLYFVRYATQESSLGGSQRGAAKFATVSRTLDACQQFLQAVQKSKFQVLIRPGSDIVMEVIDGDVRRGRELMLPPRTEVAEGVGRELMAPEPMIPFGGHTFYRPIDEMAFIVQSDPGRAWIFEFSKEENFAEIFCRVTSPRNSIRIPPFDHAGLYWWRVARVNADGLRTFFSEPWDFELQ